MPLQIKPGDIIFVQYFPFTEKDDGKARPCLILAIHGQHIWALMVTKVDSRGHLDEYVYALSKNELDAELNFDSCVRCNMLMTLDKSVIRKVVACVTDEAFSRIKDISLNIIK